MKKVVLCLFSLLLILLTFFTLVSPKVEAEMRTLVDARIAEGKGIRNVTIGKIAILWPNSNDVLFLLVEGKGWESGLRVAELPPVYFEEELDHISLGSGTKYHYIYSASREPVAGAAVETAKTEKGAASYIFWHPDTLENLEKLPNSMTVVKHSDNAALIHDRYATLPFFEHTLWYSLRKNLGEDLRVYSLEDTQQFAEAIPWIASVAAVLLCCCLLWGASWLLPRGKGKRKIVIWIINMFLIALLLMSLPWLLDQFDLPASLMPPEYVLVISHYAETFGRICEAMESLGDSTVHNWLCESNSTALFIMGTSALFAVALVALECVICRLSSQKHKKVKALSHGK